MSGYPVYPGGYPVTPAPTSSPGAPPGGPPAGQFLAAVQSITTALNAQTAALKSQADALTGLTGLTPTNFTQIHLNEIAAPAPPASGAILYVDNTTHALMAVKANGSRITLG